MAVQDWDLEKWAEDHDKLVAELNENKIFWDSPVAHRMYEDLYQRHFGTLRNKPTEEQLNHHLSERGKARKERSEDEELRPCPFCNGKGGAVHDMNGNAWVICKSCGAQGPHFTFTNDNEIDELAAAKTWNKRVISVSAQQLVHDTQRELEDTKKLAAAHKETCEKLSEGTKLLEEKLAEAERQRDWVKDKNRMVYKEWQLPLIEYARSINMVVDGSIVEKIIAQAKESHELKALNKNLKEWNEKMTQALNGSNSALHEYMDENKKMKEEIKSLREVPREERPVPPGDSIKVGTDIEGNTVEYRVPQEGKPVPIWSYPPFMYDFEPKFNYKQQGIPVTEYWFDSGAKLENLVPKTPPDTKPHVQLPRPSDKDLLRWIGRLIDVMEQNDLGESFTLKQAKKIYMENAK